MPCDKVEYLSLDVDALLAQVPTTLWLVGMSCSAAKFRRQRRTYQQDSAPNMNVLSVHLDAAFIVGSIF